MERKYDCISSRTAYACDRCGNHIYPLAGSIFDKASTPLLKWSYAMHLISCIRCGVSAKQIQRETGVTCKTAWRIFKQIRTLMSEHISLEGSTVEMDEMYVGGKFKSKHLGKRGGYGRDAAKTAVFEMVERGGRVIAMVTPDTKVKTLFLIIKERILLRSTVYTALSLREMLPTSPLLESVVCEVFSGLPLDNFQGAVRACRHGEQFLQWRIRGFLPAHKP